MDKLIKMVVDGVTYSWLAEVEDIPPVPEPPKPKIALWLQYWDFDTKAEIDNLVAWSTGRITDLYAIVQNAGTAPKTVMGRSDLMHVTTNVIEGLTPIGYLIQQASLKGIRVHGWFIIYPWSYWGGSTAALLTPLVDNVTNHNLTNGGNTIQYSTPAVRKSIVDAIGDFVIQNPGLTGINLDYIRTDGRTVQTDADVTALVAEIRTKLTKAVELSVCALSVYNANSKHQDVISWINNDLIDTLSVMAYYENAAKKMFIWDQMDFTGKTLLVGVGTEERSSSREFNVTRPSDMRATIKQYVDLGYKNFALFSWSDSMKLPERQVVIDEYLTGNLNTTAQYPNIQSIQVNPGTSISLTIDGAVRTTTFSSVSGYTTGGTLKAYIESIQGQQPWIHYHRPTSTSLQILVGDFEV